MKIEKIFLISAAALWGLTGGIHWGSAILLSVIVCISGVWVSLLSRRQEGVVEPEAAPFHGFGFMGWMLLGMMALTTLTLMPMPLGLLDLLSPSAATLYREVWQNAGIERSWGFLTVSFGDTAFALWNLVGFFGAYLFALRIGGRRENMKQIGYIFAIAGGILVAMMALKHIGFAVSFGETGVRSVFHIGLPANENHLSGAIAAISLFALGNAVSHRHHNASERRALWLIIYIVFGASLVLLKSRGALLGWGSGHLILFAILLAKKKTFSPAILATSFVGFIAILGAVFYLSSTTFGDIHDEVKQISWTNDVKTDEIAAPGRMSKTWMYADFVKMADDWGRMGTGRSAFGDVYPAYQGFNFSRYFRHAENEFWEMILEYGWFWGILWLAFGAAGFFFFFRTALRQKDEHGLATAMLAAVCTLIIQNIFDFGLRYWTVGFVFWMSCGVLEARQNRWKYGRLEHDEGDKRRFGKFEKRAGYAVWAISFAAAIVVSASAVEGVTETGVTELRQTLESHGVESPEGTASLEKNILNRASSAKIRRIVAQAYLHQPNVENYLQKARQWLASASQLQPRNAEISLLLAKSCYALGDESCAQQNWSRAIENPRYVSLAMSESSVLPKENLIVPNSYAGRLSLVNSLVEMNRFDDAMSISNEIEKSDRVQATAFRCMLYEKLGLIEACDAEIERLEKEPISPLLFDLRVNHMVRLQACAPLFDFMKSSESALANDASYWRLRLNLSVFNGFCMGESWYREEISTLFLRVRQISDGSVGWRFDMALCDAKYALTVNQFSRAENSAQSALKIRPNSRAAQSILDEAIRMKKEKSQPNILLNPKTNQ